MKSKSKLLVFLLVLGLLSCRDTKKEEEETRQAVTQIEAIEAEIDQAAESLDESAKELEEAIEALDSIN